LSPVVLPICLRHGLCPATSNVVMRSLWHLSLSNLLSHRGPCPCHGHPHPIWLASLNSEYKSVPIYGVLYLSHQTSKWIEHAGKTVGAHWSESAISSAHPSNQSINHLSRLEREILIRPLKQPPYSALQSPSAVSVMVLFAPPKKVILARSLLVLCPLG